MGLKPEVSLTVALATGAIVVGIYHGALPTVPDVRVGKPLDKDIASTRKAAGWTAAGTVAAISLIAKDPTVFIFGGFLIIATDWWYRHANAHNPEVAGMTPGGEPVALQDVPPDSAYASGMVG